MTQGIYGFFLNDESIYIGQSVNCERRMKEEISGKRINSFFFNLYKKHEKEIIWRILEVVDDRNLLTEREIYWINRYKPRCNLMLPENDRIWRHSDSTKEKIKEANAKRDFSYLYSLENQKKSFEARLKEANYNVREEKFCLNCSKKLNITGTRENYEKLKYCLVCFNKIRNKQNPPSKVSLDIEKIIYLKVVEKRTSEEIGNIMGVSRSTISRKLSQLVKEGFLEDLGGSPKSYKVV